MAYVLKQYDPEMGDYVPNVDSDDRTITGYISTPMIDRDGEVLPSEAFRKHLGAYKENPVLLLHHHHKSLPVGSCVDLDLRDNGVWAKFKIASTPLGNEVMSLIEEGHLRGFSTGFIPVKFQEHPHEARIPSEWLRTANGKLCKKLYEEVELVEVSLLAIPSNRSALIERAEKGNSAANLVVKMFDVESELDISNAIKEWVNDCRTKTVLTDLYEAAKQEPPPISLMYKAAQTGPIALKTLMAPWEEEEHPRDGDGKFSDKNEGGGGAPGPDEKPEEKKVVVGEPPREEDPLSLGSIVQTMKDITGHSKPASTARHIDTVVENQERIITAIEDLNDKETWSQWALKWGLAALGGLAAYVFLRKTNTGRFFSDPVVNVYRGFMRSKNRYLKRRARLQLTKGFDDDETVKAEKTATYLGLIEALLERGKEIGVENTAEYKALSEKYARLLKKISSEVNKTEEKGIERLYNDSLSEIVVKKMTDAEFDESEHPRHGDGKFRKKTDSPKQAPAEELKDTTKPDKKKKPKEEAPKKKTKTEEKVEPKEETEPVAKKPTKKRTPAQKSADTLVFIAKMAIATAVVAALFKVAKGPSRDDLLRTYRGLKEGGKASGGGSGASSFDNLFDDVYRELDEWFLKQRKASGDYWKKHFKEYCYCNDEEAEYWFKRYNESGAWTFGDKWKEGGRWRTAPPEEWERASRKFWNDFQEEWVRSGKQQRARERYWQSQGEEYQNYRRRSEEESRRWQRSQEQQQGQRQQAEQEFSAMPSKMKSLREAINLQRENIEKGKITKIIDLLDASNRTATLRRLNEEFGKVVNAVPGGKAAHEALKTDIDLSIKQIGLTIDKKILASLDDIADGKMSKDKMVEFAKEVEVYRNVNRNLAREKKETEFTENTLSQIEALLFKHGVASKGVKKYKMSASELLSVVQKRCANGIFVRKEMTAEEFEESEHPRDNSGKFTDKPGGGVSTPAPRKGSHGGYRAMSGRLPKEPHLAIAKRKDQIKRQNPDLSDKQIDDAIREHAYKAGKPDWITYLDDPDKYYAEREQRVKDSAMTRRGIAYSYGSKVNRPETAADLRSELDSSNQARTRFEEERRKQRAIGDAYKTFRDKEAPESDRRAAKIILGVAAIVSLFGFGALMLRAPKLRGIKSLNLGPDDFKKIAGYEHLGDIPDLSSKVQPHGLPATDIALVNDSPRFFQLKKAVGLDELAERTRKQGGKEIDETVEIAADQVGSLNRWLGTLLKKRELRKQGKALEEGAQYAITGGMKWHGFSLDRFRPKDYFFFKLGKKGQANMTKENYIPKPGDVNMKTGHAITNEDGIIAHENVKNMLMDYYSGMRKENVPFSFTKAPVPKDGPKGRRIENLLDKNGKIIGVRHEEAGLKWVNPEGKGDARKWDVHIENEDVFEAWCVKNGWLKQQKKVVGERGKKRGRMNERLSKKLLPDEIARRWDMALDKEKLKKRQELLENYKGWAEFLNEDVVGGLSRKVLAGLSLTVPGSMAYYFAKDMDASSKAFAEAKAQERADVGERMRLDTADIAATEKREREQRAHEVRIAQLEERKAKHETSTEAIRLLEKDRRRTFIARIAGMGYRRIKEGAQDEWGLDSTTFSRRFADSVDSKKQADWSDAKAAQFAGNISLALNKIGVDVTDDDQYEEWMGAFNEHPKQFMRMIKDQYIKKFGEEGWNDFLNKNFGTRKDAAEDYEWSTAGFDDMDALVTKAAELIESEEEPQRPISVDELINELADEITSQIHFMSQICKNQIESGMPGHSDFEDVNDIVTELYAAIKDRAKRDNNAPETIEKSFDKKAAVGFMSTQQDQSGGMFVKPNHETCSVCGKELTRETVAHCSRKDCPNDYLSYMRRIVQTTISHICE